MGNIILEFVILNFLHSDITMRKMRIPIFKKIFKVENIPKNEKKIL